MRTSGVEAAIERYREAGTKKYAHNWNRAQMGSAYLKVSDETLSINLRRKCY